MKYFFIFTCALFFLSTTITSAKISVIPFPSAGISARILTTDTGATIILTNLTAIEKSMTVSIWANSTAQALTDKKVEQKILFKANTQNQTVPMTIKNLIPNHTYYLLLPGVGQGSFSTENPVLTSSITFTPSETELAVKYTVPTTEKRSLSIAFTPLKSSTPTTLGGLDITNVTTIDLGVVSGTGEKKITTLTPLTHYNAVLMAKTQSGSQLAISSPIIVSFGKQTFSYTWPLTYTVEGGKATISGRIDIQKNPNYKDFTITLERALTNTFTDPTPYQTSLQADGSYSFTLTDLTPNTLYSIRHTIKASSGSLEQKTDSFNSSKGYILSSNVIDDFNSRSYRLLAPFPGLSVLMDPDLCEEQKQLKPGQICDINEFLNYALKLLIGLSAVFLILKIMYIGGKYMTTDIAGVKANAKGELMTAGLGLLVALTSYLILNTINPSLVSGDVAFRTVKVGVEEIKLTDAYQTVGGNRVKVNALEIEKAFKIAQKAALAAGIKPSHVLATFRLESSMGTNVGGCIYNDSQTKMKDTEQKEFVNIMNRLVRNPLTQKVSCPGGGHHGGAMGPTQFMPTTWAEYATKVAKASSDGKDDPWEVEDAMLATAFKLKNDGVMTSPADAACKYYSGRKCDNETGKRANMFYGNNFVSAVAAIEETIIQKNLK